MPVSGASPAPGARVAGQLSGPERARLEEQRRLERAKEEQLTHLLMVSACLPRAAAESVWRGPRRFAN